MKPDCAVQSSRGEGHFVGEEGRVTCTFRADRNYRVTMRLPQEENTKPVFAIEEVIED